MDRVQDEKLLDSYSRVDVLPRKQSIFETPRTWNTKGFQPCTWSREAQVATLFRCIVPRVASDRLVPIAGRVTECSQNAYPHPPNTVVVLRPPVSTAPVTRSMSANDIPTCPRSGQSAHLLLPQQPVALANWNEATEAADFSALCMKSIDRSFSYRYRGEHVGTSRCDVGRRE